MHASVGRRFERDVAAAGGPLRRAVEAAAAFLSSVDERPVAREVDLASLRRSLGGPLPATGESAADVIVQLADTAAPGIVATAGPRYFGFVIGGSHPAALAADWLTSAWDQNACLYAMSPAAAVVEEIVAAWLIDLFGLPTDTGVGFTTGATMASFTALAAARHRVLDSVGWDVEERGLTGAPPVTVVVGDEVHVTILAALQMLGLGRGTVRRVAADEQGRLRADALEAALASTAGPLIVCAQAGNVNTGAFDPLPLLAPLTHARGGWLHVDGAFGMWAAAAPSLRPLSTGLAMADSWTTDAHKYLNVPYDSGLVFVRDAHAHRTAMTLGASYYVETTDDRRDPYNWVPESSRRARGFAIYATLRALGRDGVADLVERCSRLARRMADALSAAPHTRILNEVVLNQILVAFEPPSGRDADAFTRAVIARVQADGTCWIGGSTWRGRAVMRISVSNWSTTTADVERSAAAILRCAAEESASR